MSKSIKRKYQRNKYLDELGIDIEEYGTNFIGLDDKRHPQFDEERLAYGFDSRETWSLHDTFIEWMYSHLRMYLDENCVDLTYHKFNFKEKEYTQEEAIKYILGRCENYLKSKERSWDNDLCNGIGEAIDMFRLIFWVLWC